MRESNGGVVREETRSCKDRCGHQVRTTWVAPDYNIGKMVLGYREDRIQYSPFGTSQGVRILFFF